MLWLMPCPPGEGRCYGEGAKFSHWASIILSVAVSLGADLVEVGVLFGGYWLLVIGYSSLAIGYSSVRVVSIHGPRRSQQPIANSPHAPLRRHPSRALQRRASSLQSPLLR